MAVIGIGKGMEQGAEMAKRIQSAVEKLSKPTELTGEMKDIFMEADEPVIYGKLSTYDREGNLVYETPYPVRQFCEDYLNGKISGGDANEIREQLRKGDMTISTTSAETRIGKGYAESLEDNQNGGYKLTYDYMGNAVIIPPSRETTEPELFMKDAGGLVGQFEKGKKCMADTAEQMVFPAEISKGIGEVVSNAVNSALGDGVIPAIRNGRIVKPTTVNILGTQWEIRKEDFDQPELKGKNRSGYCFYIAKRIVIEDLSTDEAWKDESESVRKSRENEILRHEIIHAFLDESGLSQCSAECDAWAVNEEMVDWLALQSPKIYRVFAELDIL